MFLALCREGELAWTPSGRKVMILGTEGHAVTVQCLETEETFEIMSKHLRHAPGGLEGPRVTHRPHPLGWVVGKSGQ